MQGAKLQQLADKPDAGPRIHADSADSEASTGTDFDTLEPRPNVTLLQSNAGIADTTLLKRR